VLRTRQYKTFCINDVGVRPENIEATDRLVADFLKRYFPVPSQFEKREGDVASLMETGMAREDAAAAPEAVGYIEPRNGVAAADRSPAASAVRDEKDGRDKRGKRRRRSEDLRLGSS
jgi:hypothetical protein